MSFWTGALEGAKRGAAVGVRGGPLVAAAGAVVGGLIGGYLANEVAKQLDGANEDANSLSSAATAECVGDCMPPDCKDAAGNLKEALYRNKRAGGQGGSHGLLNRMVEQMCGAYGPGTREWSLHIDQMNGEARRVREAVKELKDKHCPVEALFSRKERQIISNIENRDRAWDPASLPFKGRDHGDCSNFRQAISSGDLSDLLSVLRLPL